MHIRVVRGRQTRTALVLIPGELNYFYNLNGRRIAESLRELEFDVNLTTLRDCPDQPYDWCVLVNISEVVVSYGDQAGAINKLRQLRRQWKAAASCCLDSVQTPWYQRIDDLCAATDVETVLDLGLCDQAGWLPEALRRRYRFLPAGLTRSEYAQLDAVEAAVDDRPIPWAFVGHVTPPRAALIDYLVQSVDPSGFVYMPALAPYKEAGSPHLNQQQFEAVLHRTRYQLWCSHHFHFYMEPERFRTSLLTGSVPVKVLFSRHGVPADAPFRYLMIEIGHLPERLRPSIFERVRARFRQDFRQMKSLTASLTEYLAEIGVVTPAMIRALGPPIRPAASLRRAG